MLWIVVARRLHLCCVVAQCVQACVMVGLVIWMGACAPRVAMMVCLAVGTALSIVGLRRCTRVVRRVDEAWSACGALLAFWFSARGHDKEEAWLGLPLLLATETMAAVGLLGLPLCADLLLHCALARSETDGAPGHVGDTLLACLRTRAWRVPHAAGWCITLLAMGLWAWGFLCNASWGRAALVGAQLALVGVCPHMVHASRLAGCAAIVESADRFEQVFCSARNLRQGTHGVVADVSDEEGGVILSFTRTDRVLALEERFAPMHGLVQLAARTLMAWTLGLAP